MISRADRERRNRHRSFILWLVGLSGAGKTTISQELEQHFFDRGYGVIVLDGDHIRKGLCSDLGFDDNSRKENIRRAGEVARLAVDFGIIAIGAFISPFAADRRRIREQARSGDFLEIYLECSLEECERRDPKGLYKRFRAGAIKNLAGIDAAFEPPANPDLAINTEKLSISESVQSILDYLSEKGYLPHRANPSGS